MQFSLRWIFSHNNLSCSSFREFSKISIIGVEFWFCHKSLTFVRIRSFAKFWQYHKSLSSLSLSLQANGFPLHVPCGDSYISTRNIRQRGFITKSGSFCDVFSLSLPMRTVSRCMCPVGIPAFPRETFGKGDSSQNLDPSVMSFPSLSKRTVSRCMCLVGIPSFPRGTLDKEDLSQNLDPQFWRRLRGCQSRQGCRHGPCSRKRCPRRFWAHNLESGRFRPIGRSPSRSRMRSGALSRGSCGTGTTRNERRSGSVLVSLSSMVAVSQ